MYKHIFTLLLISLFFTPLKGQLSESNKSILAKEILYHINELRENEGYDTLQFDVTMIALDFLFIADSKIDYAA